VLIVDGHLDLAYNAVRGRNVLLPAAQQAADDEGIPSVGLPDLRAGSVRLICGTIFCQPALADKPGYRTAEEAHAMAWQQMRWYMRRCDDLQLSIVTDRTHLDPADLQRQPPTQSPLSAIILMEGADPIRTPDDVWLFYNAGLRIVGLAWRNTRYAGGTGVPGPLTREGVELVRTLDLASIIHDVSHLAEASFWQLLDTTNGPIIASHSNCRAIVPTDRQLSDEMIRAIAQRGGIIGINFFDRFLIPPAEQPRRRANLTDVVHHIDHICQLLGDSKHVALGTDMDGGLGRDNIPNEIQTSADLPRLADALAAANYDTRAIQSIMGKSWLRFFSRHLPSPTDQS
jgi:membrane dipeptidase